MTPVDHLRAARHAAAHKIVDLDRQIKSHEDVLCALRDKRRHYSREDDELGRAIEKLEC